MIVSQLIEYLLKADPYDEVVIDVDDFSTINARNISHIFVVKNELVPTKKVVVIDADWGNRKPTNCEVIEEYL